MKTLKAQTLVIDWMAFTGSFEERMLETSSFDYRERARLICKEP